MFFLKEKKKEKIPNTLGTKTVMAWNQFCKCQDIGLEFSRESKRISSSNPIENPPYTLWTNYRNGRSVETAALAMWNIPCGSGVSRSVGLQGGQLAALQSDPAFFRCPSQQCRMLQGYCPPGRAVCSCSPSSPFQQSGRSERHVVHPFKSSWANRRHKHETISLKTIALALQLTLTHVPPKQLSGERMGIHRVCLSVFCQQKVFSLGYCLSSLQQYLKCGLSKTPASSFPQKHISVYIKIQIRIYTNNFFPPPEISHKMMIMLWICVFTTNCSSSTSNPGSSFKKILTADCICCVPWHWLVPDIRESQDTLE